MGELTISTVESKRDLKRFIALPHRLRAGDPQWVAPLNFERRQFLDRARNPFFEHAEAEYFLAEREGVPVGRITAQIDRRWDSHQGGSDGMFGFFESENDPEVAAGLLEAATEWVRSRGRERIIGPMDFTTNDELGILVEGFERPPMILQPWHPPHYQGLIESQGFAKLIDLLMWELQFGSLKEGERFDPAIHEAANRALHEEGITIRNMRKSDLRNEVRKFMEVYNEAWGHNWGFVPVTEAEVAFQAKNLKQVIDEKWTWVAEKDGEVVGAALTLPDINQVIAKLDGRLLPFGWARFLLGRRKIDQCRVFALGVKHDYRHTGVAASLYLKHIEEAGKPGGITGGEMGWILETNEPMNRAMEGMGGRVVKKYRIFEKAV